MNDLKDLKGYLRLRPGERISRKDALADVIEIFIYTAASRVFPIPGCDLFGSARKRNRADKIRDQAFDFAVIQDEGMRFITQQAGSPLRIIRGDQVRWHMDDIRLRAECPCNRCKDLIPGQPLI